MENKTLESASSHLLDYRPLIGEISLLICSIVLSLAVGEGFLRLFPGVFSEEMQQFLQADPKNLGVSHPYIGHLHKPNSTVIVRGSDFKAVHHTGGYGFRNTWPWPETAEIVVVGDSVVFGYGVEDEQAWPAIINQALPRTHVLNLGLTGSGPQQYLRVYETFGTSMRPKVVLVGLFIGNDFWDAKMFNQWLESGAEGNYMVWRTFGRFDFSLQHPITSIHGFLRRHSYLYSLVWDLYRKWRSSSPQVISFADGTQLYLIPSELVAVTTLAQPHRQEFQLVLQTLTRMQAIAQENGTHLLVIFQPSKEEVYMPLLDEATPDPSSSLRTALEELGIAYLDLAPVFRQRAAAGERLFFETDGHPNAAGYALIAEVVLSHLKDNTKRYGLKDEDWNSTKAGSQTDIQALSK